jgi:pimeloyl-ACP methyl ester carboxylesterase
MTTIETHILEMAEADIAYDVRGPLPTADGCPPLFMVGQPMTAEGFDALASHFPDRTVVTYDPRGLGRSTRRDGRVDHSPAIQAGDLHAVIEALGTGPVNMFASSGGAGHAAPRGGPHTHTAVARPRRSRSWPRIPTTWSRSWRTSRRSSR